MGSADWAGQRQSAAAKYARILIHSQPGLALGRWRKQTLRAQKVAESLRPWAGGFA